MNYTSLILHFSILEWACLFQKGTAKVGLILLIKNKFWLFFANFISN